VVVDPAVLASPDVTMASLETTASDAVDSSDSGASSDSGDSVDSSLPDATDPAFDVSIDAPVETLDTPPVLLTKDAIHATPLMTARGAVIEGSSAIDSADAVDAAVADDSVPVDATDAVDALAVDEDGPAIGPEEPQHQLQQNGLPGAAGAEQDPHAAARDAEADVA